MYSLESDADKLHKAFSKLGEDDDAIIEIVANRPKDHLINLRQTYKAQFGQDLIDDIKKELSGNFEDLVIGLFYSPEEYDAMELSKAMKGLGTNEKVLIEIIGTRDNKALEKIKQKYYELYNKDLAKEVQSETSGSFKKLLYSLLQCNRSEEKHPDLKRCKERAEELYKAGEGRTGTDEDIFNKIFAVSSRNELKYISQYYNQIAKHSILEAIEKEFSRDVKKLYQTIIYGLINPSEYFADKVNEAVEGMGTDDNLLIRIILSRRDIDLPKMKIFFEKKYKKSLVSAVREDTSGDYQKLIVKLIGED